MKKVFLLWLNITRIILIISSIYYFLVRDAMGLTLFITSLTFWYQFEMRNFTGNYLIKLFPKFKINNKWFRQTKLELKLDELLKVKQWKKRVKSYNPMEFDNKRYSLKQICDHMHRAEVIHEIIFVLSYVPILFSIWAGDSWIFVITSIMASLIDLSLVIVQRYNSNRVLKLLNRRHSMIK